MFNKKIRAEFVEYGQALRTVKNMNLDVIGSYAMMANAVSNLTPKQQALVLSTKGITNEEIKRMLVMNDLTTEEAVQALYDAKLLTSKKALTVATAKEVLATTGLSIEKQNEILISAGIVAADENQVISKDQVSVAILRAKLAQEGLSATEIRAQLIEMGLISTTEGLKNGFLGLAAAIKANPLMFIITAVSLLIPLFQKLIDKQDELRESAENLISTYKDVKSAADGLTKNAKELVPEYQKLSKGVDNLGKNVSLTADEYERYQEIVNQIAEDLPQLVTAYDTEGNAILNLRDNVNLLREAYIEARKEKYRLLLNDDNTKSAIDNFRSFNNDTLRIKDGFANGTTKKNQMSALEKALRLSQKDLYDAITNKDYSLFTKEELDFLYNRTMSNGVTDLPPELFQEFRLGLKSELIALKAEYETALEAVRNVANAYLYSDEEFDKLDENMRIFASTIINSIPKNVAEEFGSKFDVGNYVVDIVEKLEAATPEVKKAYDSLVNFEIGESSFEQAKSRISKYIDTIAGYFDFDRDYVEELFGLSDDAIQSLIDVREQENSNTLSVKKLTDAYEKLSDVLDDVFKKQDKLADLYEKIAKGTELTASEAYELIDQFPELTEHLIRVGSKWSFDIKGVNEAFDVLDDEFAQKAQEVIDNNKKVLEQSFEDYYTENTKLSFDDFLKEKGIDSISINSASDYENFKKLQEEFNENVLADRNELLKSYTERQDASNAEVERAIALQQLLNNQINDFDFDVDNYNDKIKELMDASEKMAEGEALSYDELTSLIDQFPELKYSGENGEYFIEKAALDELIEKSYEERNARIDDEIAKTYAVNEEVANRVKAYEDEKERLENAIDENRRKYDESYNNPDLTDGILERIALETEHTKLINELKALDDEQYAADKALMESQDEYNEAYRKYLEALNGKLTSGSKNDSSLSNQLQDQIDYYETLLSAIEAVTDKQIEALEDEKDALEKQKDALKDANDERQRELDLIEARNNLENAKKRKVYVYTEGSGFQQAQDKKAVKEADEKLRDVELEIQEANIDKQIDKLDEQIDAFEDYKKQFSDMKSDIEDLITIEKAKNALDLDEQGLLNLPPETAKEIQEGLANAVLKKDKEDNKDNKEYERFGDVVIDRLLKKWGSPLTAEEAFKKWDAISYNSGFPTDFLNPSNGNVVDNSEVYNNSNKNITFAPNITVYGGSSEQEIADIAVKEMEKVFRATYNSIK